MTDLFGSYRSQTTRGLQQINSTKYPDTNKDFQKNIQRLNQFVDYISQYLQTMQKGVDEANQDPISKMRSTVTDLAVLLGGGELLYGINLGDLQYFLPALGAMFGFDSAQPFPLNLLYAAEHFFLGYIVPLDSWAPAVEDIIDAWAVAFGIPPDFVASLHDLLDAIQSITSDYLGLFNALWGILNIFGTLPGIDQGPFADLWHSVSTLLGGANLASLGALADPIFHGLAPWIEELANLLSLFDQVLQAFTGGVVDITGIVNLGNMFTPYINLLSGFTTPLAAWTSIFTNALTAGVIPNLDASKLVSGTFLQSLIPGLTSGWGKTIDASLILGAVTSAASVAVGGITGLATGIASWLGSGGALPAASTATASQIISGIFSTGRIPNIDASTVTTGVLNLLRIPNLPAGQITSGTFLQSLIPSLTSGWGGTILSSFLSGVLSSGLLPNFDASKITTGTLLQAIIPLLPISQVNTLPGLLSTMFSPFNPPQAIGPGQITATPQNLLKNSNFPDATSMAGETVWVWDSATNAAPGGSAKVNVATNTNAKALQSDPIQVVAKDTINASAWTQWNSLTYTGTPISLKLNLYDASNTFLTQITLATATMTGATSSWVQLAGTYIIPDASTAVWARLVYNVNTTATAGSVWFTNGNLTKPNPIPQTAVQNLTGILGGVDVGATFQNFVDAGVQGIVNDFGTLTGQSFAAFNQQISNMARFLGFVTSGAAPVNSVAQIASNVDNTVKARAIQKAFNENIDPTSDATFPLSNVWQNATLPTVACTAGVTVMADITVRDGGNKNAVTWYGYPTSGAYTNIPDFRVNVYSIDKTTNVRTKVHSSINLIGSATPPGTGSAPVFNSYNLPASIANTPGDRLTAEIAIMGSGTYNVVGQTISSQLPFHSVYGLHGLTRGAPAVTYDAVGTGAETHGQVTTTTSITWSHTATVGAYVVVALGIGGNSATANPSSVTATYDGVAMTLLGTRIQYTANGYGNVALLGIPNVPGGSKTIVAQVSATTAVYELVGNSVSYLNVGSASGFIGNGSNTSPATLTVTNSTGGVVVAAFGMNAPAGGGFSGINGNQRSHQLSVSSTGETLLIVDSSSATPSFSEGGTGSNTWGAAGIVLNAAPTAPNTMNPPGVGGSQLSYSRAIPWIGMSGTQSATQYTPVIVPFYSSGSFNPALYTWANYIDIVVCGPGGNGMNGSGYWGGYPGGAGGWAGATLTKAQWSAATINTNVTGGGSQTASSISVSGWGSIYGGAGTNATQVSGTSNLGAPAGGPGDYVYNGVFYPGGAGGQSPQAGGSTPGGGGAGGNAPFTVGSNVYGGPGGNGIAYIRAYQ